MGRLLLATGEGCPNCGPAKQALKDAGFDFDTFDARDEDAEAQLPAGVRSIPALIKNGEVLAIGLDPITQWIFKNRDDI